MTRFKAPDTAFKRPTQRNKRVEALDHLKMVRGLPCLVCGASGADPHHIKMPCAEVCKPSAGTMRPDDWWTVPMCRMCHNELHERGEMAFWLEHGALDVHFIALALWAASTTGNVEWAERIINANRR